MAELKIGSLNVWGLGNEMKRRQIFSWLREKQFNVYFLQETRCTQEKEQIWESEWGYKCLFSSNNRASQGVMILFMNNIQFNIKHIKKDEQGRYLIVIVEIENNSFMLVNVYGPNVDDAVFYDNLFTDLEENIHNPTIMGGDLNICLTEMDKQGGRTFNLSHRNSRETLLQRINTYNLADIWRIRNPEKRQFTWRQRAIAVACRLDYFLISDSLVNVVDSIDISHGFRTDHSFIQIKIGNENIKRGPGFFKLNTSLLTDKRYIDTIRNLITRKKTEYNEQQLAPDLTWEMIKLDVRGESVKFAKNKNKDREKHIKELEKRLYDLEQEIDKDNIETTNEIEHLKTELKKHYDIKIKGTLTRAKVRWLKDGEKNSKYFIGLEKRNYLNKTIKCLYKDNGEKITNFKDILAEEKRFYQNLYAEKVVNLEDENINSKFFINTDNIPKLNEDQKQSCEGLLSTSECLEAIKSMPNNKSPGTDGLPAEFYKLFWNDISDILVNSFNYSYNKQTLSISQKQGIITLLPKKDKDTRFLKNWRPISLLNTDYKIMTKCIALRLKKVLPTIIHPSQTGFMKDRYIGFNIRLILDLIDYAEQENKPGVIFSVDFEKAFDSVSWDYLEKCIDYFNFGNSFKNWIKIFTNDISSCILNCGWSTGFFPLQRGVRQGCPLSPYLFLLCAEVFGIGLRNNINITGMAVNELKEKLIQFADDTQILLNGAQQSLNESISMLDLFEIISGMKVNFDKSEIAKLGSLKNEEYQLLKEVKFTESSLKILGVNIPTNGNHNTLINMNYNPVLKKIKEKISQWSKRSLTLFGKATIIKSLILPQIIYLLSNLPSPPQTYLKEIDDLIFNFIWNNKRAKIKRSQLYLEYSKGGLGIPNVYVYSNNLKLKWIKYLADENFNSGWKKIFLNMNTVGTFIYKCNIKCSDISLLNIKSRFWNDVLQSWAKIHYKFDNNINIKSKHPQNCLWYNSDIKLQKKIIYYKQWHEKGILYVRDALDQNSNFLDYIQFKTKYDLNVNFLKYYGLINKIRNLVNRGGREVNSDQTLHAILYMKSASKYFYKKILDPLIKHKERNCFKKWERATDSNDLDWETIFNRIYSSTIDTKLRNFQFKLIHNILPDNRILLKMGIIENDLCNFCNNHRDSVVHYLWYCPKAQQFWNNTIHWFQTLFDTNIEISLKTILFGDQFTTNHTQNNFINFLMLISKHYLHCCKWIKTEPSLNTLKDKIKQSEKIEKEIAFQTGKIEFHNTKWQTFQQIA